ncbi:MAG TPA: hypothetical protein DEB70_10125 [Planctomycetaceae bacterium]|nr:hypothetical protein [Planctomycetaceae bacterium]
MMLNVYKFNQFFVKYRCIRFIAIICCYFICSDLVVQVAQAQPPGFGGAGRPARNQGVLRNGDDAPDFTLHSYDESQVITLSDLRGKPSVLVFGSCTCPPFVRSTSMINSLYDEYHKDVNFLMIYIREAHPIGGREVPNNQFTVNAPTTLSERCELVEDFNDRIQMRMPIVVDTIDDAVADVYAPWPNRLVVVDANGKIVDVGIAAAGGTRESSRQLPALLDRLLENKDE